MDWWDLGEWSGYPGHKLATHQIPCAFCGAEGNFETIQHLERKKPGSTRKALNYDTLKCGNCGNFMFAFWSAGQHSHGSGASHDYQVLPWHRSTTTYPKHWPDDAGRYWVEARRSIEGQNWTAAALMARSAVQLVARSHGARGSNLKQEIDDLADKGLILPIMKDWSHEVRELANEGTHPQPGSSGTSEKDAKDVVEFLTFLMRVMHELPKQIEDFRKRRTS
ncbi:DUF4145 domain-containing protein [Bradyrhizobium sp. WSM471]|uniref:DUF4145 domain-containing protein n=1 Tax=Bradyrhizobium sp. WSM471 TaxID=319017 RepID=UPI00024D1A9A|nr:MULTISPECIES: DUF4145 domain-containing protein [Bradyrhizobium]EHQ99533.1 hypothetical protein Bra471DRAFT_00061 [Bradyrhizobium sp. WSM471]UFW41694.1 DUF4145 domain-containing protein [Bradyrhizobium canariense]